MPTDQRSELFYLVDKYDRVISSITREKAHSDRTNIHRGIGIFITNELGQILMQQRSLEKDMNPGEWSYSVGGHVTFGQTYKQAAVKELEEELGIKARPNFLIKTLIVMEKETEQTAFYEVKISSKTTIIIDKTEVEKIKWIKLSKLKHFIKNYQVTDWTLSALKAVKYI